MTDKDKSKVDNSAGLDALLNPVADKPSAIFIGYEGPQERFNDPGRAEVERQMQSALALPSKIDSIATHEAGHLRYLKKMGPNLGYAPNDFTLCGPMVEYSNDNDPPFYPTYAAIATPIAMDLDLFAQYISDFARVAAAGGIFSRHFYPSELPGDVYDHKKFQRYYYAASGRGLLIAQGNREEEDYWNSAICHVQKEIARADLKREIDDEIEHAIRDYRLALLLPNRSSKCLSRNPLS